MSDTISARLQYLAERLAERREPLSQRECHTLAQELLFFADRVAVLELLDDPRAVD